MSGTTEARGSVTRSTWYRAGSPRVSDPCPNPPLLINSSCVPRLFRFEREDTIYYVGVCISNFTAMVRASSLQWFHFYWFYCSLEKRKRESFIAGLCNSSYLFQGLYSELSSELSSDLSSKLSSEVIWELPLVEMNNGACWTTELSLLVLYKTNVWYKLTPKEWSLTTKMKQSMIKWFMS